MSDETGMRKHRSGQVIQGFAPCEIRSGVTSLNLDGIAAIRLADPAPYYIGAAQNEVTEMPAGPTVVPMGATTWTFTQPTTLEVMFA